MIVWGTGGDSLNLGSAGTQHCETCERERPFHYHFHYRYFHLYWLFGLITKKQYLLLCDICNRGWNLESGEVEKRLEKPIPVPFMRQFGLLTLGAVIAGLILIGSTGIQGVYGLALLLLIGGGAFFWVRQRKIS